MPLYETMAVGNRKVKVYEITKSNGRKHWEVWESLDGRGIRLFGPTSRVKCYEFISELESKEQPKRAYQ